MVAIPHLIASIGNERFGLLSLAWAMMSYAGVLDLGIGRALTQMVSRLRGQKMTYEIPIALATAARITMTAGLIGSVAIVLFSWSDGAKFIKAEHIPLSEIHYSILLLAIALPAQAMSATYRGMNEAYLNFRGISILRVVLGTINFAGPLVISFFSTNLAWLIASLVASRVGSLLIFRRLAFDCLVKNEPDYTPESLIYSPATAKMLFSFGGWVTVSSIISPMMVQMDRFLIASMISAAAVTVYVVPYELVAQSLVLVSAISSVIFPTLTRLMQERPREWLPYFQTWLFRVGGMMFLVTSSLIFLMPYILKIWLKGHFDPTSVMVGQILCLGIFSNSLGSMYYALLHAKGKAHVTAKIHMFELPLYLTFLYFALKEFGVVGAAIAWSSRITLDMLLLTWNARKLK